MPKVIYSKDYNFFPINDKIYVKDIIGIRYDGQQKDKLPACSIYLKDEAIASYSATSYGVIVATLYQDECNDLKDLTGE